MLQVGEGGQAHQPGGERDRGLAGGGDDPRPRGEGEGGRGDDGRLHRGRGQLAEEGLHVVFVRFFFFITPIFLISCFFFLDFFLIFPLPIYR